MHYPFFPSPPFACLIRAPSPQFRAGVVGCESAVDSIRPYVLCAIEAFGIERCMFASNFPVDKPFSHYDAVFNAFKPITKDFSARGQRALFHDNAERVYRL
ncbi:putative TIM-barrel fold metal-dependent hydrolase [Paraburkholderia atlantica]|uniref:amidohydrolase family protein n=1 Tax=Paraburkholderia atlantica TaxID=2654982 RepID=UPI003D263A63